MMILVGYATTEGQTRKIARHVADRLVAAGHSVELVPLAEGGDLDPARFDGAILAGSIHGGRFQKALVAFARERAGALAAMPSLFLPVSLSAAGTDEQDWAGLGRILADFEADTGWHPGRTEHVAGAFRFGEYDFFRAWAMRWIAREKGETVDPEGDTEYTDWDRLSAVVAEWVAAI